MSIKTYQAFANDYHAEFGGRWSWCVADGERVIAIFRRKKDAEMFLELISPSRRVKYVD